MYVFVVYLTAPFDFPGLDTLLALTYVKPEQSRSESEVVDVPFWFKPGGTAFIF